MTNEEAFITPEEKEAQEKLAILERQAHKGALYEDWMRHQCGQEFSKYLDDQISDAKNRWLSAEDREAAELIRVQSQVYQKVKQWIAAQIASGKVAANGTKRFVEEGVKLEGWIVDQSSSGRPE